MSDPTRTETTSPYAALRDKVEELRRKYGELTDAEIAEALNSPEGEPITIDHDLKAAT